MRELDDKTIYLITDDEEYFYLLITNLKITRNTEKIYTFRFSWKNALICSKVNQEDEKELILKVLTGKSLCRDENSNNYFQIIVNTISKTIYFDNMYLPDSAFYGKGFGKSLMSCVIEYLEKLFPADYQDFRFKKPTFQGHDNEEHRNIMYNFYKNFLGENFDEEKTIKEVKEILKEKKSKPKIYKVEDIFDLAVKRLKNLKEYEEILEKRLLTQKRELAEIKNSKCYKFCETMIILLYNAIIIFFLFAIIMLILLDILKR